MDISQLVATIDATIAQLAQSPPSDGDRQQLLAASKRLQAASESPLDSVISIVLGVSSDILTIRSAAEFNRFQIHRAAAIRTAVDMGLFNVLLGIKNEGIKALELAEKTSSDEVLVTRIMRFLTAMGYAEELGACHYTSTPKTGFFAPGSPFLDVVTHMCVSLLELVNLKVERKS
jgi:hypothetical protein